MSHTPSDPVAPADDLRRDLEQKIRDLEQRLEEVERAMAERARLLREGGVWTDDRPGPGSDPPDRTGD